MSATLTHRVVHGRVKHIRVMLRSRVRADQVGMGNRTALLTRMLEAWQRRAARRRALRNRQLLERAAPAAKPDQPVSDSSDTVRIVST